MGYDPEGAGPFVVLVLLGLASWIAGWAMLKFVKPPALESESASPHELNQGEWRLRLNQGVWRLWIVATLIWWVVCSVWYVSDKNAETLLWQTAWDTPAAAENHELMAKLAELTVHPRWTLYRAVVRATVGPLLVIGIAYVVVWITQGFRRSVPPLAAPETDQPETGELDGIIPTVVAQTRGTTERERLASTEIDPALRAAANAVTAAAQQELRSPTRANRKATEAAQANYEAACAIMIEEMTRELDAESKRPLASPS
jgi:hypothetical protein